MDNDFDFSISRIETVFYREAEPDWTFCENKAEKSFKLALCLGGRAVYESEGKTLNIEEGDLAFFPANTKRTGKTDKNAPWSFIHVGFKLPDAETERIDMRGFLGIYKSVPSHVTNAFSELLRLWTVRPFAYLPKCRSLIYEIVHFVLSTHNESTFDPVQYKKIGAVIDYIRENYRSPIDMCALSEISGYSIPHLRKLFREITGSAPMQYVNRLRMNIARDLLISGEMNVTDAAYAVGIRDIYYFSRLFKNIMGHAPSEYIRHHK